VHCKRCCTTYIIRKIAVADDPMANTRNPPPVIAYRNAALQLVHAVQILLFFFLRYYCVSKAGWRRWYNDDNNNSEHYHLRQNVTTIILSDYSNYCDCTYIYIYINRLILLHFALLSLYSIARCIVNHSHLSCMHFARVHALCRSGDVRKTKTTKSWGKKTHVNNSLLPRVAITSNDSILYAFVLKQILAYCRRRRDGRGSRDFFFPFRSNGIAKCFIFYTKKGRMIMYMSMVFYLFYKALNDNEIITYSKLIKIVCAVCKSNSVLAYVSVCKSYTYICYYVQYIHSIYYICSLY